TAALEITLFGPILKAVGDLEIAVVGGAFGPAPGRAVRVGDGHTVALVGAPGAVRAIAAVAGGVDGPPVLARRAPALSARFGGCQGSRLERGDALAGGAPHDLPRAPEGDLPSPPAGDVVVRAMPGPQEHLFDADARAAFWGGAYRLQPESNRMGLRLRGA